MSKIFSRLPDETVKIASACRRQTADPIFSGEVLVFHRYQIKEGMIVVKKSGQSRKSCPIYLKN
jgi:hypothetical protein